MSGSETPTPRRYVEYETALRCSDRTGREALARHAVEGVLLRLDQDDIDAAMRALWHDATHETRIRALPLRRAIAEARA